VTIGSGLGDLTAGPFAARYRLSTLVLESNIPSGHLISIEVNGTARSLRCWRHRQDSARQAITSAGDGVTAAVAAYRYIKETVR
jgi:thioredoxin reductase